MRCLLLTSLLALLVFTSSNTMAGNGDTKGTQPENQCGMKIKLASVFVEDQDEALKFYTETLGFVKKQDVPVGQFRWLTVVSPDDPNGTELLLEPNDNPAARTFQEAIFEQGIPATMFFVDDIVREVEQLKKLGVVFTMDSTDVGTVTIAVFDDTCGNLIQIVQE